MVKQALTTILISIIALAAASCGGGKKDHAIARVFDKYLYEDDIADLVPAGTSPDDSAALVSNYIQQWIQEMVVLEKAENNIDDNFEKELQNYKNSLISYNYERLIVEQQLDTNVADSAILNYYNSHKETFTLKNNILRAVYVVIPAKSKNIQKIRSILSGNDLSDKKIVELEHLASNQASAYNYDKNLWMTFFDFQSIIPVKTYNEEFYLKNIKNVFFTDNETAYIAKIIDSKVTDDISPIDFEYQNIKNIILNQRKVEIVNKMRTNLMQKAEADKEIEIYNK